MTRKKGQAPRRKHRGEHNRREKIAIRTLVMALGATTLYGVSEVPHLGSALAHQVGDVLAYYGPEYTIDKGQIPKTLPPTVSRAITNTTVKVSFSQFPDQTGSKIRGTGVAVRGGFLTAAHIKKKDTTSTCANGLVSRAGYTFPVSRRGADTQGRDVALLEADAGEKSVAVAPLADRPIAAGDLLYAASFQPISRQQDRGPLEARAATEGSPATDKFTKPVIAAAVSLGKDRQGNDILLTGLQAYGTGAAQGVDALDSGASGGPLYDADGSVVALTSALSAGDSYHDYRLTGREIQRKYRMTLHGVEMNQDYQVMIAEPVNNGLVDALAQDTQNCR